MNKRIRKKQLKRTLRRLVAICEEREAARERIFQKALQDVVDAYAGSREAYYAALGRYMDISFYLLLSGPPPRALEEYRSTLEHQPPHS